jgi:hypothetical protein
MLGAVRRVGRLLAAKKLGISKHHIIELLCCSPLLLSEFSMSRILSGRPISEPVWGRTIVCAGLKLMGARLVSVSTDNEEEDVRLLTYEANTAGASLYYHEKCWEHPIQLYRKYTIL